MATAINTPSIKMFPSPATEISGKHLIFQLGSEEFAINVMNVKEIMKMQAITSVPQTPSFVQGVINLRGKIVPVINLRRKFGIEDREDTDLTCIVVVRMQVDGGEQPVGIVVDGVVEVLTFNGEDIEDTPDFGLDGVMPYVRGMAKIKGRVKIVLDIEQVLRGNQLERMVARS
ncbi:purine-binding chemotaxis protein CheW [Granulicella aggregans]|uniref:Chemotaxis protein CheW n=1 Tax=Granulicella aggregans TaxID=474949 RepID=A0A7W7ZG70_9BACT|nr:purine-binding chemotaxis protein CheW [Granulicella aggregans]